LRIKVITISLGLALLAINAFSQDQWRVNMRFIKSAETTETLFPDEFFEIDSLQIQPKIQQYLNQLYELGYLSAFYKISKVDSLSLNVEFLAGKIYRMVQIRQGNVSDEIMNKVGFKPLKYKNSPFSQRQITKLINSILDYAENHGYPFATVKLDSIQIQDNNISALLNYNSGPSIVFDSLLIDGYDNIKTKYLMTHLGIYPGKLYQEKLIEEIPNKIKLLTFVRIIAEPEISIENGKCQIRLQLQQEKVSQMDGVIGILPNEKEGNKILFTGQLMLDLHNLFASGKRIAFEWQSFDSRSQFLDIMYIHPNLLRTPINIQAGFNLLKQDTTFLNRSLNIELSFLSRNSSQIGFITDFFTSRMISTYAHEEATKLPENYDFNLTYYGLNYKLNRLNDAANPSVGYLLNLKGTAGQKKIMKNPVLADSLYDDILLSSIQIKIDGRLDKYWPLYKFLILRTQFSGGFINGNNLFPGDLYRIGGLKSLRGFTEKSIFASSFGLMNLELRAYLSSDTYFMIFFDQSYIKGTESEHKAQYPFGTGMGLSFNTNSGIFNFALALGKSENQPLAFNYAKIHFGYVARF